tara:strand:+ start:115 stop:456 length:342 start_codon:yes stop_codon:yes gene_type:complete
MKWTFGQVDEAPCSRCGYVTDRSDLDRMLWCRECIDTGRSWAKARSWLVGVCIGLVLALWIWIVVEPSSMLIGGWVGTVLAAIYVSARVTREILYGAIRMKTSPESQVVSSDE